MRTSPGCTGSILSAVANDLHPLWSSVANSSGSARSAVANDLHPLWSSVVNSSGRAWSASPPDATPSPGAPRGGESRGQAEHATGHTVLADGSPAPRTTCDPPCPARDPCDVQCL